jgi:hypothetical protein
MTILAIVGGGALVLAAGALVWCVVVNRQLCSAERRAAA